MGSIAAGVGGVGRLCCQQALLRVAERRLELCKRRARRGPDEIAQGGVVRGQGGQADGHAIMLLYVRRAQQRHELLGAGCANGGGRDGGVGEAGGVRSSCWGSRWIGPNLAVVPQQVIDQGFDDGPPALVFLLLGHFALDLGADDYLSVSIYGATIFL
jgi:hypothetical protein